MRTLKFYKLLRRSLVSLILFGHAGFGIVANHCAVNAIGILKIKIAVVCIPYANNANCRPLQHPPYFCLALILFQPTV